jgi:N-acetylmuramoyl-L-alanine amidase
MSPQLQKASTFAVAATFIAAVISAQGSGAVAQDTSPAAATATPAIQFVADPVVQQLPAPSVQSAPEAAKPVVPASPPVVNATTLAAMVAAQPQPAQLSRELECLAGAIYFESKGESLPGQLAVGRVIVARSKSGRFPASYCGVVFQPSQFSFVRGRVMPGISRSSRSWRDAVAIAQIAHGGSWRSPVEGALFFHAARVSPNWRLARLGRIDNHIFYR